MPLVDDATMRDLRKKFRFTGRELNQFIAMLERSTDPRISRARRVLINKMRDCKKFEIRDSHDEGSPDATMHVTVYIDGEGHHLKVTGSGTIFQITDKTHRDMNGVSGFVPPGAHYIKK